MSNTPDSFSDDSFHLDDFDEAATPDKSSRPDESSSSEKTDVAPERIRQIHTVCRLLEVEGQPETHRSKKTEIGGFRLDAFARTVLALAVLVATAITALLTSATQPVAQTVVDYRLGPRYTDHEAGDVLLQSDSEQLLIGTQGGGVHQVDARTRFLRHLTTATTRGGLLSDDIQRMDRDSEGRPYFLCRNESRLGLCRAGSDLTGWQTLIGFDRFAAIDVASPLEQVSAVASTDGLVWIGTRTGGVGAYSMAAHTWQHILTTESQPGLLDDQIRDLATDAQGRVWIATASGLNRFEPGGAQCESFPVSVGLAGADIINLSVRDEELWYVTSKGGLGCFDGTNWTVLAPESGWKGLRSEDVAMAVPDTDSQNAWFVGHDGQVARYELPERRWTMFPDLPESKVVAGAMTTGPGAPRLWLGTDNGLVTLGPPDANGERKWQTELPSAISQLDGNGDRLVVRESTGRVAVNLAGKTWRTAAGTGNADVGPKGALAAARDPQTGQFWIGTEKGLSVYDPVQHEWSHKFPNSGEKAPRGDVTDVRVHGGRAVALTAAHQIGQVHLDEGTWQILLGGGRFPATQKDITAVTRDSSGQLWLGTAQAGLHRYDTARHCWHLVSLDKNITQLVAAKDSVWVVSGGKLQQAALNGQIFSVKVELPALRFIRGSIESPGVLAIGDAGEVVYLKSAEEPQLLVGTAAAPKFDPASAGTVGILGPLVAFGGQQPHFYNTESRSWTPIQTGAIDQIVSSLGHLWLKAGGRLFRASADGQVDLIDTDTPVRKLAATATRLVVLGDDYRIQFRTRVAGGWQLLKPAAAGPNLVELTKSNLVVAASGEDLYLAGTDQRSAWHFSWRKQIWTPITDGDQQLSRVRELAADTARVYLVQTDGTLYSGLAGQTRLSKVTTAIRRVRTHKAIATATTDSGRVVFRDEQNPWTAATGVPSKRLVGELRQAVAVSDGLVLSGEKSSAWLSSGLAEWQSLPGPDGDLPLTRLFKGKTDSVWGLDEDLRLYLRTNQQWAPVRFPVQAPVRSAAIVPAIDDQRPDELWVCLTEGSVFRVTPTGVTAWSRFTKAPGRPQDIVGITSRSDGFLVAFRTGRLATFRFPEREWREEKAPVTGPFRRLQTAGDQATGYCLLLAGNGSLWRASRKGNLDWSASGKDVAVVTVSGQDSFALTGNGGVLQIKAAGNPQLLLTTGPAPPVSLGQPRVATELSRPDGTPVLVLAFQTTLAAYDPDTRKWHSLDRIVTNAWPMKNAVLIQSKKRSLEVLEWKNGLAGSPLAIQSPVRTAATRPDDQSFLAATEDGQVILVTPDARPRSLIGKSLPAQVTTRKIVDVQMIGPRLYLSDSAGQLHRYHLPDREWTTLSLTRVSRMVVRGEALYVEAATSDASGRTLYRVTIDEGQPKTEAVQKNVLSWDASPVGIVIESGDVQAISRVRVTDAGQTVPFPPAPAPGPSEKTVTGTRVTGTGIWLRETTTSANALWQYLPSQQNWLRVSGPDEEVSQIRLTDGRAVYLSAGGELILATMQPDYSWKRQTISRNVTGFDADDSSIVWTTAGSVGRYSHADSRETARIDFATAAWTKPANQVRAAAAMGAQLLVSNQEGELAAYNLKQRAWSRVDAPGFVPRSLTSINDHWIAVGPRNELTQLQNGKWATVSRRGTSQWQSPKYRYSVSAQKNWLVRKSDDSPPEDESPSRPAPISGSPVRLLESAGQLWIEFSDGALRRYDINARQFASAVKPATTTVRPTGLIQAGKDSVFVDGPRQQVWRLPATGAQLTQVKLPDGFRFDRDKLRVVADGLLLVQADDSAVLIGESTVRPLSDLAEIKDLVEKGIAPAVDRLRTGKSWRLRSTESENTLTLQFSIRKSWKPVALNRQRAALTWDVVSSGLNAGEMSILLTEAGIVIRRADGTGLPVDVFPVVWEKGSPETSVLFEEAGRIFLHTLDERGFRIPETPGSGKDLESLPTPASPWRLANGVQGWSFSVEFSEKTIPVSLDAAGRFGFDVARSVSLLNKSVFVATRDGLFEYALQLDRMVNVPLAGRCDVLTSTDRSLFLARTDDRAIRQFNGAEWVASGESWSQVSQAVSMTDRDRSRPLTFPVSLTGSDTEKIQATFQGNRLDIDELVPRRSLPRVTHDGRRTLFLTRAGLVVRDDRGRLLAVHRLSEADGLVWGKDDSGKPSLLIRGPNEGGWRLAGTKVEPVASFTNAIKSSRRSWRGVDVALKVDNSQLTLEANEIREVIDLKLRGFHRDTVTAVGIDSRVAWLINHTGIERISIQDARREKFPLPPEMLVEKSRIHRLDNRLFVRDGERVIALMADGTVGSARLTPEDQEAVDRLHHGARWRVNPPVSESPGGPVTSVVGFQNDAGAWVAAPFRSGAGFAWDSPKAIGATARHLVLSTAAGDLIGQRTPQGVSLALSKLAVIPGPEGLSGVAANFWTDQTGTLWRNSGTKWSQLDQGSSWTPAGALPERLQTERNTLSRSAKSYWRSNAEQLSFVEVDADGNEVASRMTADGTLAVLNVMAAARQGQSLWLLTSEDLRELNSQTHELIRTATAPAGTTQAEFRMDPEGLFLRTRQENNSTDLQLIQRQWTRTAASPFTRPVVVQSGLLRLTETGNRLTAHLRDKAVDGKWHPVAFSAEKNQFEFQLALDAVITTTHQLSRSAAGILTWTRDNKDWQLTGFRPDLQELRVPASGRLLATRKSGGPEEFQNDATWSTTTLTPAEEDTLASSPIWQVTNPETGPVIQAKAKASPAGTLSLSDDGGFELERPTELVVMPDGVVWSGNSKSLVRYAKPESTPSAVWSDDGSGLFRIQDRVYAESMRRLRSFDRDAGRWNSVSDQDSVTRKRSLLHEGPVWKWRRNGPGRITGTILAGQQNVVAEFDVQARRFRFDVVHDAGLLASHAWLSHAAGLSQIGLSTQRLNRFESSPVAQPVRYDRVQQRLMAGSGTAGYRVLTADEASPVPNSPDLETLFTAAYRDPEWRFGGDSIRWKGIETDLSGGLFAHDRFQTLTAAKDHLIVSTAAGLLTWRLDDDAVSNEKPLKAPPQPVIGLEVRSGQLRALSESGETYETTFDPGAFDTLEWKLLPNADSRQILIESPGWKWTRGVDQSIQVTLGDGPSGDEAELSPPLTEGGRFPFDEVATILATPNRLILSGPHGLSVQRYDDGQVTQWKARESALPPVDQFIRVGSNDWPVASWSTPEQEASELFAVCRDSSVWKAVPKDDSFSWSRSVRTPESSRLLRVGTVEVHRDANSVRLQYENSPTGQRVLIDGRFSVDVMRSLRHKDDNLWLGTNAGLLKAGNSSQGLSLISAASDGQSLAEVTRLYQPDPGGTLCAATETEQVFELGTDAERWKPADTEPPEVRARSGFWTWMRHHNGFRVSLHRAGSSVGEWPLFMNGRFSFDVLRGFRIGENSLQAVTAGGLVEYDLESMETQWIDRSAIDDDSGQDVPLTDVLRFAGDGTAVCYSEAHSFRREKRQWHRKIGAEQLGEQIWKSSDVQWQLIPRNKSAGFGFDVLLQNPKGQLLRQYTVLPGVPEKQLKRVIAEPDRLWICLDRGVHFLNRD